MVVLHLQMSCDGCASFVVSNGVGLVASLVWRFFKNAEGMMQDRRCCLSLMQVCF